MRVKFILSHVPFILKTNSKNCIKVDWFLTKLQSKISWFLSTAHGVSSSSTPSHITGQDPTFEPSRPETGLPEGGQTSGYATWFTAGSAIRMIPHRSLWRHLWRHNSETIRDREKRRPPRPWNPLSYPTVKTASLYDNFCKTRNDVIYDVIIWVQDGNCKKWLERILVLVRCTI